MSQLTSEQQAVVAAVLAHEAKTRIDFPLRPGVTFFSENDVWLYDATLDGKVCDHCRAAEIIGEFRGNNLRMNFPDLEIIDENTILPHVHVTLGWRSLEDDTCRCVLKRVIGKVGKV